MVRSDNFKEVAKQLIDVGSFFNEQHWAPATTGSLSSRLDKWHIAITVADCCKGEMDDDDITVVDLKSGKAGNGFPVSDESKLHARLYHQDDRIGAVLHSHSRNGTVLSKIYREQLITLTDYEALKVFPDIDIRDGRAVVPVFSNHKDFSELAEQVENYLLEHPAMYGCLIEGHGFYTWGMDVEDARRHIEAFEFLFACEMDLLKLGVCSV